ncbi:MAG TPA: chemotaxis response regulator protein-glutamate methylesterase [Spirochaetota bacterium]|mgnify:CR=1 FL=1|nr:chemotaxis response regulator protein-glutamate methylesterase [Spirochaetota bacterium]HOM37599.1 chemotaxis response regulator protein-glutamate methylesterase [Spirochaetota bacterium]HPQ49430.1 chemotaxis response regulator protein-glutamate methylesterase [Spirochaetota bacterium]
MDKIKVLIVDDSAIVREYLTKALSKEPEIDIIGTAPDPYIARDKIVRLNPDVITLDIEMPRMDGLTFLQYLMKYKPTPVIIVSSITAEDESASIKALELGAFDIVNKPGGRYSVQDLENDIIIKIKNAYKAKDEFLKNFKKYENISSSIKRDIKIDKKNVLQFVKTTDKIIGIGASTGGTVAIEYIISKLPSKMPPIVITQHMPPQFTFNFAQRLDSLTELKVKEAENGELLLPNTVYLAPGGYHMEIERRGANYYSKIVDGEKVNFQKPAVDVMFKSMAKCVSKNTLAILLTGMGKDGAEGLLELKNIGAITVAQDEESSVVWGMPKAAIDIGASNYILGLEKIPEFIINFANQ